MCFCVHSYLWYFMAGARRSCKAADVCLSDRGRGSPTKSESSQRRREINAGLLIQALGLWRVSGWEGFSDLEAHSNPLDPDKNGIAWIRCLCHHSLCVTLSSFPNFTSFFFSLLLFKMNNFTRRLKDLVVIYNRFVTAAAPSLLY